METKKPASFNVSAIGLQYVLVCSITIRICLAAVFLVAIYINIQRSHTFTLSNDEGTIKTEQIQPLWGTVKVSGDCDTEVVFTDVETGEKYRIGYITQGVTERIKLERGKWYKVAGGGNLTLNPVNIRVE